MNKLILSHSFLASALCLAIVLTASRSHADVILSESFSYSDGDLAHAVPINDLGFSKDANNKWTSGWGDSADQPASCGGANPGLSCYQISGGRVESKPTIGGINGGVERTFTTDLAAGTTAYFGFDIQRAAAGAGVLFGMYLDEPGAGGATNIDLLGVGQNPAVSDFTFYANMISGGQLAPAGSLSDGVFHRVVAKLEFDAGATSGDEKLTIWLNPAADAETANPNGDLIHNTQDLGTNNSLNGLNNNGMALGIMGRDVFAEPVFYLDNINLTTDFASAQSGALHNGGFLNLSYGHQQMVTNGLQLEPVVDFGYPSTTTFDPVNWSDSNFTGVDFLDRPHPGGQVTPPAGLPLDNSLPWSRLMPLAQVAGNIQPEEIPFLPSLRRLWLEDEANIVSSSVLDAMRVQRDFIHINYPGVLVHTNLASTQIVNMGTGAVEPSMVSYLSTVKPDAIIVNQYPYLGAGPDGGSPTWMYTVFERVRQLGLGGHDGSGDSPIPTGVQAQAFTDTTNTRAPSESEIRQQHFAAWAFGMTTSKPYIYDDLVNNTSVTSTMFTGSGTGSPTVTFDHFKETNRQSLNLGDTLVRLISTDARMIMGEHDDGGTVANTLPTAVTAWDSAADPYITSISATNLGSLNNSLRGDVIVGYFEPLSPIYTDAGTADDDDIYFMIVNGLSDSTGLASATQQEITINFDFLSSGITGLQRLSRNTGLVEDVMLTPMGGSTYEYVWTLDGGTGDLFKFDTGSSFVTSPNPADFNMDGVVDSLDLGILLGNFGTTGTPETGELNGTAPVDSLDLGILLGSFGASPLAATAAVPEPTSALLLLLGCTAIGLFNRPRNWQNKVA
ncbi:MAG: PEP-CTERM sorting domain-containing protein [Pirellulales bacterium]|nr:PEP-CTERM sorting domain-containing protein [Pirellulales bacterium]